jgi:hypothetical protein
MTFTTANSSTASITAESSAIPLNAATEPTTVEPSSAAFTAFVLRQLRCAELRAELVANQCKRAAAAVSGGLISPEMALLVLHETGVELDDGVSS